MSAQPDFELSASNEGFTKRMPQEAFRIIQGGLEARSPLGEMPTPVAYTVEPTEEKLLYDCPPKKFEAKGVRGLSHDLPLMPGSVQIDF